MKYSTTTTRTVVCVILTVLLLGLLAARKRNGGGREAVAEVQKILLHRQVLILSLTSRLLIPQKKNRCGLCA